MGKIVFIGDSITLGVGYGGVTTANRFSTLIGKAAGYADADIINAGVGSNNSADVLARLQADVIAHSPAVCVVMVGTNDCYAAAPKYQTAAQYKANVTSIVQQLRTAGIKVVLMSTSCTTGTAAVLLQMNAYLKALEEVVGELDVPYVDIYREYVYISSRGEWATYGHADNVHPSANGHAFIAEYAARAKYAGFFVADPVVAPEPEPEPEPGAEHLALTLAIADYVLATGKESLTAAIATAKAEVTAQ